MSKGVAPIEIVEEKLNQAVEILKDKKIDMWITFVQETSASRERVFEYVGVADLTWESAIILTKNGDKIVILGKFDDSTYRDSKLYTEIYPYVQDFKEPFSEVLKKHLPSNIALNYSFNDSSLDGITYGRFIYLQGVINEILPHCKIVSAEDIIGGIISQKSPKEIEYVQKAIEITEKIFERVSHFIKPKRSEKEIYAFLQEQIASFNTEPSFDTLVFAGDRGDGMGHGKVTENLVEEGDLVHIDMGVFYKGYASDLQRTFYIARRNEDNFPEEVLKGFNTIKEAIVICAENLKSGVKGVEIDKISRDYVVKQGFEEYKHALGHQLGRFVHDGGALLGPPWPRYKNAPFIEIKESQIFTLEPSLNVKNYGAVGIEEDVLTTKDGAKFLSHLQEKPYFIK